MRLTQVVIAATLLMSCVAKPPAPEEITVWQSRGTWSGHAGQQTDPFISTTGLLRLTWEAKRSADGNRQPADGSRQPVNGPSGVPATREAFRIVVHSDVSGRPLLTAVDRRGPGKDVTYVTEDPRAFFLVIESEDLDWTVEVSEGLPATRQRSG